MKKIFVTMMMVMAMTTAAFSESFSERMDKANADRKALPQAVEMLELQKTDISAAVKFIEKNLGKDKKTVAKEAYKELDSQDAFIVSVLLGYMQDIEK